MPQTPTMRFYVVLSRAAFIVAGLFLALFLWQAETLVRLGLDGMIYYLVLVTLALAVSIPLFGILKSTAIYKGKTAGHNLQLGGPIVCFFLVVGLGLERVPKPPISFDVTVITHQESTAQAAPLRQGKVLLHLGGDLRTERLGEKGEAHFVGIPAKFRGQKVAVVLDAQGYEAVQSDLVLSEEAVTLDVKAQAAIFRGYVTSPTGHPVAAAKISLRKFQTQTADNGYFELPVNGINPEANATLQVMAPGYAPWSSQVVPGGNGEIKVVLERQP